MTDAHQTLPRVLILGASGGVGRWVCRLATERSIHATALIRQGSAIETTPPVTIARGDALNPDFLRSILPGHSAASPASVSAAPGHGTRGPQSRRRPT